ncbi:FUSC family protein [Ruania zhangjianzhongii]|uniref:FUSC family protein n=1 Tax=Ruania zhangjianzhongii TaxID=2603206 RepID=UPI0011C88870|nr:FUSC family protein [Ruania zhangjianzhongii]
MTAAGDPHARTGRSGLRRTWLRSRARARRGGRRVRSESRAILTAALAAGAAYAIAHYVLGHAYPIFAPIAAFVSLGFGIDRRPRKVAELALGVSVGVAFGELFALLFGSGPIQVAVVLALAVSIARLIDGATMFGMQAGVQSVVVVALPAMLGGGGFPRWTEALVGGSMALLVAILLPLDVRRRAERLAESGMTEIALTLEDVASGIRTGEVELVDDALTRARGSQGVIDEWADLADTALDATRLTPSRLRHEDFLRRMYRCATLADRAMRNARVIARRAGVVAQEVEQRRALADLLDRIAQSVRDLSGVLGSSAKLISRRPYLLDVAGQLDPRQFTGWPAQTLVVLIRSLVVDLLEMTGLTGTQAREALAGIGRPDPPAEDGSVPPTGGSVL